MVKEGRDQKMDFTTTSAANRKLTKKLEFHLTKLGHHGYKYALYTPTSPPSLGDS
jgi:hypothetical protein